MSNELEHIDDNEMQILRSVLMFIKTIKPYEVCEIRLDKKNYERVVVVVRRNESQTFDIK